MDELQLQRELLGDLDDGSYGFKVSSRFLVGIPDLYIQSPNLPAVWLEIKFVRGLSSTNFTTVSLTPKQRAVLTRIQAAGGRSGWLLAVQLDRRGNYVLACGTDPSVKRVRMSGDDILTRERGATWPIMSVIHRIACASP